MMNKLKILIYLALVLLVAGCVKPGIDVNREGNTVSKVAIVSVFSNAALYNIKGGGGFTALASLMAKKAGAEVAWGGTKLVSIGLESFATEMDKLGSIEIIPTASFIDSPAYKNFSEDYLNNERKYMSFNKYAYTAVPGMVSVTMGKRPNHDVVTRLAELANELGVDGVAVIQLDLAYRSYNSFGGTGSAKPQVAANLCIVNKYGKLDVSTPWDVAKGGGIRFDSDETGPIMGGELIYNSGTEELFREAIIRNAVYFSEQIAGNN